MPDTNLDPIARLDASLTEDRKTREAEMKKIADAQHEALVRLDRLEKHNQTQTVNVANDVKFNLAPIIRSYATGRWDGAEGTAKRTDMSVASAANGGYIVPAVQSNQMVDILRAKAVLRALGTSVVVAPRSKSITRARKTAGSSGGGYLSENTTLSQTSVTFTTFQVTPHLAGCYAAASRLLAENSDPSIEKVLRDDFAASASLILDDTGLFGTGAGSNPTGLFNNNDVSVTSAATAITLDLCLDAITAVEGRNALVDEGKAAFLMHPALWGKLRKTKGTTNDHYILSNDPSSPTRRSIQGYPVYISTRMELTTSGTDDAYAMAFGVWSQLEQTVWDDITIESSTQAGEAFLKHQLLLKMVWADDWTVLQPDAFQCYTDLYSA